MTKPEFENVVYINRKKSVKGNYIGASCNKCNWSVTHKRNNVSVLFHNFSGYDGPLLISGMVSDKEKLKSIKVTPKGATGYHMIQYKNIKMIDSCSFLQGSLSMLVSLLCKKIDQSSADKSIEKILPITIQSIRESKFNNDVIPFLTGKLIYPHGLVKNLEDFEKINIFPNKEAFYDVLSATEISDEDYNFAKTVYEKAGCKNLRWLHDLYLLCDVSLLSDVWRDYNHRIFNDFGLYAANYVTGPQMCYRAALKMSKQDIKLLEDQSMYDIFQDSIRGGYCCVNKRRMKCNNVDMGDKFNSKISSSTFLMLDFNGLYAWCLTEMLPYDKFCYLNENVVQEYNNNPTLFLKLDTSDSACKGYWVTVDFEIPDHLKYLVDDFPLAMVNTESIHASPHTRSLGKGTGKKLIAAHFPLEKYGFHIKLLKFYLSLGCKITKVHNIIEFEQKRMFDSYIQHCVSQRKKADIEKDPVLKRLYKLLANALYGKCLQSDIKYNTNSVLVEIGEKYSKLCGKNRFKSRRWVINNKVALVTSTKKEIFLTSPIFIGATVLQLAKLKNYSFHYQVIKPSSQSFPEKSPYELIESDRDLIKFTREYIYSIELCYQDTDSLGYYIVFTEKGKYMTHEFLFSKTILYKYLDKSNFTSLSKKDSICEPGDLGYLKSEIKDDIPTDIICLTPKCYSIISYERETNEKKRKFAIKGANRRNASEIYKHEIFKKILEDRDYLAPKTSTNHIRRDKNSQIHTVREIKSNLSILDNKRFWVDSYNSYGYGHPEIYRLGYNDTDIEVSGASNIRQNHEVDIANDVETEAFSDGENELENSLLKNGETYNFEIDDEELVSYRY